MKKQGGGKIINIGSMMSIFGASFAPPRGLEGWNSPADAGHGRGLDRRQHPGQRGAAGLDRHRAHPQRARQVAGLHDSVLRRTPAKRWGVEQDMAGVAVFLASSASDFVTGAAIPVDGGYSIQG
jgi:2-deoxy-D-gluconate 3-dehydrogenase